MPAFHAPQTPPGTAARGLRLIQRIGLLAAMVLLPALVLTRVFEIVTRVALFKPASLFNQMESEAFVLLVFLVVGAAQVDGAHVRVDVFRHRFSARTRYLIEWLGTLFFVLPFTVIVLWFGLDMTIEAWRLGQRAALAMGRPWRWLLVASVPLGIGLFALACWLGLRQAAPAPSSVAGAPGGHHD